MDRRQSANWRLRIGFLLSAFIGVAWGLLLGWLEIRVNAWLSPGWVLFVGMPIAFFGSMIVGMVFHRMLQSWHKLARLLVAILTVAIGFPFGLLWSVLAHGYDPFQLINESGVAAWNLEWVMTLLGLFGGMWPRWTLPFLKLLGRLGAWLSQGPVAILRWIGNKTMAAFESVASFFQTAGRVLLWLPMQIQRAVATLFQNLGTMRERWERPPQVPPAAPQARPARPRRAKTIQPKKSAVAAKSNGSNGDSLRVTGVVEDRCPYCLDIVKRNDSRGIKLCQVCGTPHHADCWAITGKCQVPHLNT